MQSIYFIKLQQYTKAEIAQAVCDPETTMTAISNRQCTGWSKKLTPFCAPEFHQILTDFQTYITVRIGRTFVMILSLKIPPHLKCVATLPCEMSVS